MAVQWHCTAAGCLVEVSRLPQPVCAGCRPHAAAQALKRSTQAWPSVFNPVAGCRSCGVLTNTYTYIMARRAA